MTRVLVTGATGIVGSETVAALRAGGHEVIAVSARGSADGSVLSWRMGVEPAPSIPIPDVVVHAAADTRWTLTEAEAYQANVASADALAATFPRSTRIVLLSTSYARPEGGPPDAVSSYRNTYEWSKAQSERAVAGAFDEVGVLRFPIVIGRRSDGAISRLAGIMKLFRPILVGLVPVIVGDADALLDLASVDDVARRVIEVATADEAPRALEVIGFGRSAPTVNASLAVIFDALDSWRGARGVRPVTRPPIVTAERWDRFYLPFARVRLTPVQLQVVDMLSQYRPYLSVREPFAVDVQLDDPEAALRTTVQWWAETYPRAASALAEPW